MSDRITLFFEPLDVLHFRDYRPFDAGFNVLGQSVFPLPGVFLGCVRAALFRDQQADFRSKDEHYGVTETWAKELLGGRTRVGTLTLRGPLLARYQSNELSLYFSMPADLVPTEPTETEAERQPDRKDKPLHYTVLEGKKTDGEDGPRFYHRRPGPGGESGMPQAPALPWTEYERAKPKGGASFLTKEGARRYCEASTGQLEQRFPLTDTLAVPQSQLLKLENRYGISRSPDTLTVEPQRFYLQRPYRLARNHGFAVEVMLPASDAAADAIRKLCGQIVQLGGRGHRARITVLEQGMMPADLAQSAEPARKLWLLTPAPLHPELPAWPQGMTVVAERVQAIGGFDQAHRRPRPLMRALPAGSIVYLDNQSIQAVETELCGFPGEPLPDKQSGLDDEPRRLQHAGFTMALSIGAKQER